MKYLLFVTFSAIAFGQTPASGESAINNANQIAALGAKLSRLNSALTASRLGDENKANTGGSPVLLQQVTQRPVEWTKTPDVCSLLTTEVTGSGRGRTTITLVRNPKGTFNYKTNDEVSGTAVDGDSHHYIFLYAQNLFVDSGTGIPSPTPPYDVYGTDTFELIPLDGGVAYRTAIYIRLHINADGSFTDQGSAFTPNAFCDPI